MIITIHNRNSNWALVITTIVLLMLSADIFAQESVLERPGHMVDIGTHRMHLYCVGEGQPVVVMDAGLGGLSLEWNKSQQLLATSVKVCVYDRAGYGWSEPGPMPRVTSRLAEELYMLLTTAEIPMPYVLVGHSFGGYTVQLFAKRYPYATAGLVLVDASHPEQVERFRKPPIRLNTAPTGHGKIIQFSMPKLPSALPDELVPTAQKILLEAKTRVAIGNEYLYFQQSAAEVIKAGNFPDVPMVVMTRGERVWSKSTRGELMEKLWMDLQTELAESVQQSAHIIAKESGHHIHLDQPELVTDVVRLTINATNFTGKKPAANYFVHAAYSYSETFQNATWRKNQLEDKTRITSDEYLKRDPLVLNTEKYIE